MSDTQFPTRKVRGRKDYRCYLCGHVIPKGQEQTVFAYVADGAFGSCRCHDECLKVTEDNKWDEQCWESHEVSEFREELTEWRKDKEPRA